MKYPMSILIDVGSSTVKVYSFERSELRLISTHSIPFKNNFDPEKGISEENKKELINLFTKIKKTYNLYTIKTYATAIFRKLHEQTKIKLIDEIYQKTGIFFNIISHDLENFYLELALTGKFNSKKNLLLVNIGGGSTELVVIRDLKSIERHNVELGIGTLLTAFPGINNDISNVSLKEIVAYCKQLLPELKNTVSEAFYNGGELLYMQLVGYPLRKNTIFTDKDHPSTILLSGFKQKNEEVFSHMTLSKLESFMPKDPRWMHGARGCSALAQAIFERYHIKIIIPSNSNLIDGVVRQEF